jgi:FKBP-type peptidyl-prolyl cis-trans isomerase 2
MVRRSIAAGASLLVAILFLFLLKGCLDSRKESAFEDYVREVSALVGESNQQSDALFALLTDSGGASEVEITNQLNAFGVQSEQLVDRAEGIEHPDEVEVAHGYLVETLEFRRDGVRAIATELPAVVNAEDGAQEGTDQIARAMLFFSTSDIIYQARAKRRLEQALEEQELALALPPDSFFLPDIELLQPDVVADRIAGIGGGSAADGEAAPGLHGNGLASTSLGGQALTPGGSATVPLSDDLAFEVQVANQGENTETDVNVVVTIGEGGDEITVEKALDEIAAGETKAVEIPLTEQPATGQNVPIKVEVEAVPGEEKTDNNAGEYSVIFTS